MLSFATPCVLPLVPAYLAAVGAAPPSTTCESGAALAQTLRGVAPFMLGFGAVFVFFGALVGAAGSALDDWRERGRAGLRASSSSPWAWCSPGVLPLPSLPGLTGSRSGDRPRRCCWAASSRSAGRPASGRCWPRCWRSPRRAAAPRSAALLLGAYAAGLAVPLIASAVAFDRTLGAAAFLRDRYDVIRVVSGIVLVMLGLLVFFDRTWWLSVAVNRILRAARARRPHDLRALPSGRMAVIHVHGAELMIYSRIETQLAPLGHSVQRARPGLEGAAPDRLHLRRRARRARSARSPICGRRSCSASARTSSRTRFGRRAAPVSTASSRARRSPIECAALVDDLMI